MIPAHFGKMVMAEVRVVFMRLSGRLALGVSLVLGLLVVGVMHATVRYGTDAMVNGMPLTSLLHTSAADCAGWGLRARNFFVLPLVLLLASAGALGGEINNHTLREQLVRPVSRLSTVLAKLLALLVLSGASLVLTLVPTLGAGALLFGAEGSVTNVLLGYLASWGSDFGLICLGLLVSTLVRSTGAVVVVVTIGLMADLAVRGVLAVLDMAQVQGAALAGDLMPGAALAAWEGWKDGWQWEPFLGLGVLVFALLAATMLRFQRMDIA